jgi:chloramphenicol O-acetyltransferase
MILKNGAAVEVKKIQSLRKDIALNSSPPKDKLYSTDTRITEACRQCEDNDWDVKDLIYTIGVTSDSELKHIWMVYGDCYAADKEVYSKTSNKIQEGIKEIQNVELAPTNELARLNKVDPLGITYFRVRGMWGIQNPMNVYSDIYSPPDDSSFSLAALVSTDKYNSFPEKSRSVIENNKSINISDIEINDPNNPAKLIKAKLITYTQL